MTAVLGSDDCSYEALGSWAQMPDGWELGDVGGIGVDAQDNVYVFNRSEHPMAVFDRVGNFLRSWGEGIFVRPHAVSICRDGTILVTDDGDHTVRRMTPEGEVLLTIGTPGRPSPRMSGIPFNRCTHTAESPEGDIYISDGYSNARVHKYSRDGEYLSSWGEPGTDEGCFNIPHNIACDAEGKVYVADRENHRIQVFDPDGKVINVWHNFVRPNGLAIPGGGNLAYICESTSYHNSSMGVPNLGPRVTIYTTSGELVQRLNHAIAAGVLPGQFLGPHGIAVDSHGDIYVGEVPTQVWPRFHPNEPTPPSMRSLQKLVHLPTAK